MKFRQLRIIYKKKFHHANLLFESHDIFSIYINII